MWQHGDTVAGSCIEVESVLYDRDVPTIWIEVHKDNGKMMSRTPKTLLVMLVLCVTPCMAAVLRVDSAAEGVTENGATWASAYVTLQGALSVANGGDEIWVAAGTYFPAGAGDRSQSFVIPDGVAVYG